jgi:tRNA threonylcarbamoyladenosine biosynthesis protein TsaB
MNVLALDCCLDAVSVAVRWQGAGGEWLLREAFEPCAGGHAERLFPLVAEVMEAAALSFPAIDRIAATVGPGSFTGVRVGIAAARALVLASGKPVVGATSLAVMAHGARQRLAPAREGLLAVAVDARGGAVYLQLFGGEGSEMGEALLTTPAQAACLIAADAAGGRPVSIVGSAGPPVAEALKQIGRAAEACLPDLQPHASVLALMAPGLVPAGQVRPLYLRQPDARVQDGEKSAMTARV